MSGELHSAVEEIKEEIESFEKPSQNLEIKVEPGALRSTALGCDICCIKVTSANILRRHLDGRKHKMRVERIGKIFECEPCEIVANSEAQLQVHLNSAKHKARLLKKEFNEFTAISTTSKGIWILFIGALCVFINLILLFKMVK